MFVKTAFKKWLFDPLWTETVYIMVETDYKQGTICSVERNSHISKCEQSEHALKAVKGAVI